MNDLIELKRARPPDGESSEVALVERPRGAAPSVSATQQDRERWSQLFVAWFLSVTGGDVHPDGGPAGHRWRMEYFECVRDPQAFERYADTYINAYRLKEK